MTLTLLRAGGITNGFDPISVGDLQIWLKADAGITLNGSNVSQWDDQSGNGRNFKQATATNQPAFLANSINSTYPSIDFDGSNDFLALDADYNVTDPMTWFVVYKRDTNTNQGVITGGSGAYPYLQYGSTFYIGASTRTAAMTSGVWYLRGATLSALATTTTAYSNGVSLGVGGNPGAGSRKVRYLGQYNFEADKYLDGKIAEILIYNKILTGTEINNVNGYLNTKYAIY